MQESRVLGQYDPSQPSIPHQIERASGITDSIEVLFSEVERRTLVQIVENRFKQRNIY